MKHRSNQKGKPRKGVSIPWGFIEIDKSKFDTYYEHLLEAEDLDRSPQWNDRQATVTWCDVHGHPALLLKEWKGGMLRYVKGGYQKHRFEPVFGRVK